MAQEVKLCLGGVIMRQHDALDLESDVYRKLQADERIDAREIKIEIDESRVTLRGTVPSFYEKLIAEEHAIQDTGLENVTNLLQVVYPGDESPPVEFTIRERVKRNLQRNRALSKMDNLNVRAEGSKVILEGSVDSTVSKRLVENEAAAVEGVTEVANHLAIVPSRNLKDELIGVEIMKLLNSKDFVGTENLDIIVENGQVTLQGVVSNWSEKSAVNKVARYPLGVFEVVDKLNIARERKEGL